ncbi:NAD(P)-binding protein [Mycena sanguinolenta]|uniref:NAD(P)-binding protein n=1 Tax=Mycena sanguinolenta TaxID=230812 RepID=A0A8H6TWI5_9AGAR|nr:NAD(P)-binding protein [Mycena sanguinolenta]
MSSTPLMPLHRSSPRLATHTAPTGALHALDRRVFPGPSGARHPACIPPSMSTSLAGKVAVITGSSRSIGAAIAKHMASQGAKVVVNYVNGADAASSVVSAIKTSGGTAVAAQADVSTIAGGQRLVDESVKAFGGIDILVLNPGIMDSKVLADVEAFFDAHFATNVKGPLLAKAAASVLPAPGGRIIFFSTSLTGASTVSPTALVYTATKGAVEQLSRILAKGTTVNTVSPGPVDTPFFRQGKPEALIAAIAKSAPSGRLGEVDDIAPVVSFLASPAAQWVNGQNVSVNGGFV